MDERLLGCGSGGRSVCAGPVVAWSRTKWSMSASVRGKMSMVKSASFQSSFALGAVPLDKLRDSVTNELAHDESGIGSFDAIRVKDTSGDAV